MSADRPVVVPRDVIRDPVRSWAQSGVMISAAAADETAPPTRGIRIAIDADCPGCGGPERAYDVDRGVFTCSSMGGPMCDYESTERDA